MNTTITPAVKASVTAYLLARTYAEVEKDRTDKICRDILTTAPYYSEGRFGDPARRIINPDEAWRLSEVDHTDYLLYERHKLEEVGYKINDPPGTSYKHPALTARSLQRDAELLIITTTLEMLGKDINPKEFSNSLLSDPKGHGLERRQKWIDLVVKMVLALPDYTPPKIGEGA